MAAFLWAWDDTTTEWIKVEITAGGLLKVTTDEPDVTVVRKTDTGLVVSGAAKLYWMGINPAAGLSVLDLSDDIDGSTAAVFDHFHTSRESHVDSLAPPMPFANGIYVKTWANMTSAIFAYRT